MIIKKILYTALILIVLVVAAVLIHGRAGKAPQPAPANNAESLPWPRTRTIQIRSRRICW